MVDSAKEPELDFKFRFNDPNLSDRTLRLIIIPDDNSPPGSKLDDIKNSQGESNCSNHSEEKLIHVSSLLLAAKSPFFRKLFTNGMRESSQQRVDLHIQASEEAAVMDLLKFMYSGSLSGTTPSALLDVVMVAEKYEVVSCIKLCKKLLLNSPMTLESALLYSDTASTNLIPADIITPLSDAAKKFVDHISRCVEKCQEELVKLPLVGFEVVFSSDRTLVKSDNVVLELPIKSQAGGSAAMKRPFKKIVIEHSNNILDILLSAFVVKKRLEEAVDGLEVVLDTKTPWRDLGCFEVREVDNGEVFVSLHDMERPYKQLTDLDLGELIAEIVEKIKMKG